jgi:hypothetical protein
VRHTVLIHVLHCFDIGATIAPRDPSSRSAASQLVCCHHLYHRHRPWDHRRQCRSLPCHHGSSSATITLFCNFYAKRSIGTLVLPFCSLLTCRTSSCLINSMLIPHGHASTFRSTPLLSRQDQQPAWIINRTHI